MIVHLGSDRRGATGSLQWDPGSNIRDAEGPHLSPWPGSRPQTVLPETTTEQIQSVTTMLGWQERNDIKR